MSKIYLPKTVYQATQERLEFIFNEFEHIFVSFSGGKDSGLVLNMVMQYMDEHGINRKIGLFHQDFEAQYQFTTDYVTETFDRLKDRIEPYWVCLPMGSKTPLSNYETVWYPWDPDKQDVWVRPMPNRPDVINLDNNPFDFYKYKMMQDDLYAEFGKWYSRTHGGKCCCILGMRADESMNRFRAIKNKVHDYKGQKWMRDCGDGCYSALPIYDWTVEDVWTANAKFNYPYNKLYDMYYKAGLTVNQMRVASPFNEWAVESLNVYRVVEPETWVRLLGRVQGANFTAIYGNTKAMGRRPITLPQGHTWKSYTMFLLQTLPPDVREGYIKKFKTSIEFWHKTGGGLPDEAIQEIKQHGCDVTENGKTPYGTKDKTRLIFNGELPDELDDITTTKDAPSWKRMCMCILKNDHLCRTMGFAPTKDQQAHINAIKNKYKAIIGGK